MSVAVNATLADLLPDDLEGLGKQIKEHLGKEGPAIGWSFVEDQALAGLRTALRKVDLCEQLAQAWVSIAAVRAYREPGKLAPGETAVVPLRKHQLSFTASPTLKLKIGEVQAPDLKLTYGVTAAFDRATLSVRDRALVAAEPGECAITATLSCGKTPLHAPWVISTLRLPGTLRFSPGWAIP